MENKQTEVARKREAKRWRLWENELNRKNERRMRGMKAKDKKIEIKKN